MHSQDTITDIVLIHWVFPFQNTDDREYGQEEHNSHGSNVVSYLARAWDELTGVNRVSGTGLRSEASPAVRCYRTVHRSYYSCHDLLASQKKCAGENSASLE